ncbi:DUF460 domain-containing protein [Candidatus Micrarchaeota archaeon]|nr:DUF460 domain-containing protein [Candidatus Micrarchaeota archaeon]
MNRFLIAGVDPGTTAAFAVLDLNKRVVKVASEKNAGKEWVVEGIQSAGTPIVIACDVVPAPEFVVKIAAAFNCKLFTPNKNLTEEEKRKLASNAVVSNVHELDALASAINAFHFLENKFRKVERVLGEKGVPRERVDEAKQLVASGVKLDEVLKLFELEGKAEEEKQIVHAIPSHPAMQNAAKQLVDFRFLVSANAELRKQVERLENEKKLLAFRLARSEKGVSQSVSRDKRVLSLENEVARLKLMLQNFFRKRKNKGVHLKSLSEKQGMPSSNPRSDNAGLEKIVEEYRRSNSNRQ